MKEVFRSKDGGLTNSLTPLKPYLLLNEKTKEYHVLYWVAWFDKAGRWQGSDWYDSLPQARNEKASRKWHGFKDRIWELPGVKYDPPRKFAHGAKPLKRHMGKY